jgi:hypothetical protein
MTGLGQHTILIIRNDKHIVVTEGKKVLYWGDEHSLPPAVRRKIATAQAIQKTYEQQAAIAEKGTVSNA